MYAKPKISGVTKHNPQDFHSHFEVLRLHEIAQMGMRGRVLRPSKFWQTGKDLQEFRGVCSVLFQSGEKSGEKRLPAGFDSVSRRVGCEQLLFRQIGSFGLKDCFNWHIS